MLLSSVRVRSYKCIGDSGPVPVEESVTSLVGKNESGKTAFLEALYRLHPAPSGKRSVFDPLYDYPRPRRSLDSDRIDETEPIEATFLLDPGDVAAVEEELGRECVLGRSATVRQRYDNTRRIELEIDEQVVVRHLVKQAGLSLNVARNVADVASLRGKLERSKERQAPAEELLETLRDFDLEERLRAILWPRLPRFLYFDAYSTLPGRVSLPYLERAGEGKLHGGERTALALLRLAGLEDGRALEAGYEARQAALEAAATRISDEIFSFWSQHDDLRVLFDIDGPRPAGQGLKVAFDEGGEEREVTREEPPFLEIRIWNDRHRVSLNFGERSAGFVWFFSFLAYFSEFRERREPFVLLLDEPGLGLHATAQMDLLRFIDQRLGSRHQVIYSTHSPFMIRVDRIGRARAVEDDGSGTRIHRRLADAGLDTVLPLRAALGHHLLDALASGGEVPSGALGELGLLDKATLARLARPKARKTRR